MVNDDTILSRCVGTLPENRKQLQQDTILTNFGDKMRRKGEFTCVNDHFLTQK